jgi:hypothetical protein
MWVLILLLVSASAVPASAEFGFDEKYERDYNIFNPASRYAPDNPFNPANRFDPGSPVNPGNQYSPNNPFNPANQKSKTSELSSKSSLLVKAACRHLLG